MNLQLLKEELIRYEGREQKVYLDTLGLKTAGVGHLLLSADRELPVGHIIADSVIDKWFDADIIRSTYIAKSCVTNFDQLDDTRQRILIQLAFNMGNRLLGFKKTLALIEQSKFAKAADELQDSKWFTQVGRRGPETCYALRTGLYGWRPTQNPTT